MKVIKSNHEAVGLWILFSYAEITRAVKLNPMYLCSIKCINQKVFKNYLKVIQCVLTRANFKCNKRA